jgi:hypothetical protein
LPPLPSIASVADAIRDYIVQPDDESIESRQFPSPASSDLVDLFDKSENTESVKNNAEGVWKRMKTRTRRKESDCNCPFLATLPW